MAHHHGLALLRSSLLGASILAGSAAAIAWPTAARADIDDKTLDNNGQLPLPSGQFVTPQAATGAVFLPLNPGLASHPDFVANGAIKTAVSPDGKTLLVMTSGYNEVANAAQTATDSGSQFIFVYDITGANARSPVQRQVIPVPNTYVGLVWAPDGSKFYVSGGSDDKVWTYGGSTAAGWSALASIALNHASFAVGPFAPYAGFIANGLGFLESAMVAGLGLSADGSVLVAANIFNDSISVIDLPANAVRYEFDLRPFSTSGATGVAGGEAPFSVAVKGVATAYVSSIRDREVVVASIAGASPRLITRISLPGNPNSLLLNADQTRLYVTQDNSDTVAVIDTTTNAVIEQISTAAPPGIVPDGAKYTGASPNNLAFSPDGNTLYVSNGGANSVAVIPIAGPAPHAVASLVPTAFYPNAVSLSADGGTIYVANGKSDPGKDPGYTIGNANNQYIEQLTSSGLLAVPVPGSTDTGHLSAQVAANNGYSVPANPGDATVMAALRSRIQHIIYIIKENRTYDQVLGDVTNGGNGDATLTQFGKRVTPNFHRLAQNFVTLDNFFCSGEVSGNGWAWVTAARESDHGVKTIPVNYAGRGASNDSEGTNRNINVAPPGVAARTAALPPYGTLASAFPGGPANLLPGTNNDFATDGPNGLIQAGFIWDAALRAGLTVRSYGVFVDISRYSLPKSLGGLQPADFAGAPANYLRDPAALGVTVAASTSPSMAAYTDPYFRGFDNAFPDVWRVEEWQREFTQFIAGNNLPNLTMLRLMHDHMGNFGGSSPAVGGLTTPETQQADNDLAVGRVVDAVAHSPYAGNTLIFVVEDDAQDGPDHMDAHRSTAYVVGPYVKQNAVVSTRYSSVNVVRTIEDILGTDHLNLNDAYQRPMTDVFDLGQVSWTYNAIASAYLRDTTLALDDAPGAAKVEYAEGPAATPLRTAAYWAKATRGFDFSGADRVPAALYNEVLWEGLMPGKPYPVTRPGDDLRRRRFGDTAQPPIRD